MKEFRHKLSKIGEDHRNGLFARVLLLLLTVAVSLPVMGQGDRNISGTVSDLLGNPLAGVTVLIPGTTQGVSTDAQGSYILNVRGGGRIYRV